MHVLWYIYVYIIYITYIIHVYTCILCVLHVYYIYYVYSCILLVFFSLLSFLCTYYNLSTHSRSIKIHEKIYQTQGHITPELSVFLSSPSCCIIFIPGLLVSPVSWLEFHFLDLLRSLFKSFYWQSSASRNFLVNIIWKINSLRSWMYKNVFVLPSFFTHNLTEYRILD